jgi:hypothetical protein
MALGLFSLLNYLAKVHLHLVKPERFVTEKDNKSVKNARKKVEECLPELKRVLKESNTSWKPPRIGDCNETYAFEVLVEALNGTVNLGFDRKAAAEVWKKYRNALAHMARPDEPLVLYAGDVGSVDMETALDSTVLAFIQRDAKWRCSVDKLHLELPRISSWLCELIESCADLSRLDAALKWDEVRF